MLHAPRLTFASAAVLFACAAGGIAQYALAAEKTDVADTAATTSAAVSTLAAKQPKTAVKTRDFSDDAWRRTVVAAGTPAIYQGHPTTLLMPDGKTIYCVWSTGHGGPSGSAAVSVDGGLSWKRIDERFPKAFSSHVDCPSIYALKGPDGKERLWVWSAYRMPTGQEKAAAGGGWDGFVRARMANAMPSVMSEDGGLTWREFPPLGGEFACIMAFCGVERLKDGSYLGVFHRNPEGRDRSPLTVWKSRTKDGGFTWERPEMICDVPGRDPCEPALLRSPDGKELCCLMRSNKGKGRSLMMFSRDEGRSWTPAVDASAGLSGHRHVAARLKDGRYFVAFRSFARSIGYFTAWVGSYEALRAGSDEGAARLLLLRQHKGGDSETRKYWKGDLGYPGVSVLPDGTVVAVTYAQLSDGDDLRSVVAVRLRPEDLR